MVYLDPGAGAIREARTLAGAPVAGTDEIQTLTIGGTPSGGTFRLAFKGQVTAPIAWSAVNGTLLAAIDAALEALSTMGAGTITAAAGTLTAGIGTLTLTFTGPRGKQAVPTVTVFENAMTGTAPTIAVAETTPGVDATFRGAPKGARLTDTTNGKEYINTGTAVAPTWTVVGAQT